MHRVRGPWSTVGGFLLLAVSTQLLGSASAPAALPLAAHPEVVEVIAQDLELGRELYSDQCGPCHGDDGKGGGPAARFLATPPRDLTDGSWTLEGMIAAITDGVPDTDMEAFEELLTEDEISAVAAYVLENFAAEEDSR